MIETNEPGVVAGILERAAARILAPGPGIEGTSWTRGTIAARWQAYPGHMGQTGAAGTLVRCEPDDRAAVCWCAEGAVEVEVSRAAFTDGQTPRHPEEDGRWLRLECDAMRALAVAIGGPGSRDYAHAAVEGWNDRDAKSAAEVAGKLRAAAVLAAAVVRP